MVCILGGLTRSEAARRKLPLLALGTILIALTCSLIEHFRDHGGPLDIFSADGSLHLTVVGSFATCVSLVIGALLVLISWRPEAPAEEDAGRWAPDRISIAGEFYGMMLFSLAGVALVTVSNNLIVLFMALELVSVPTYVLVTLSRRGGQAKEAGLKYFFLGAMAAALTVYGFSFLYGLSGSVEFGAIRQALAANPNEFYLIALVLTITGLCFKIAALPLHFYVADVYQGASSSVTALLAFMPKIAGFYSLMVVVNLLGTPLWGPEGPLQQLAVPSGWMLWVLAAGTMTVGNVLALKQRNVKRLLAYSSIAHSGYMMLALLVGSEESTNAIYFYITVYAISTLGAFGVLALIERQGDEAQQLEDLVGLGARHPGLAAALAICIFSLIGMPMTGGFVGKLYVFSSLVGGGDEVPYRMTLLVIALVNAAVAAAYYLRIIGACYLSDGTFSASVVPERKAQQIGIALATIMTLILGVAPSLLIIPLTLEDDRTQIAQAEQLEKPPAAARDSEDSPP